MYPHYTNRSFIATLSSVEGLVGIMPKLGNLLEKTPWIEPFLNQLSPILVVIANGLYEIILRSISKLEGPVSGALLEVSTFSKISAFMIIQTFFVSFLSGSLISQLSMMIENPTMIVTLVS